MAGQALDKHWKGSHACPICSSNTWDVGDVCELRGFTSEALVIGGGPAFPIFPLVCTVCGYTRFFNAYLAQVVALSSAQEDAACAVQ
jgi:predicted nucleic-acid-binding Zn-ribbon protein